MTMESDLSAVAVHVDVSPQYPGGSSCLDTEKFLGNFLQLLPLFVEDEGRLL